MQRLAKCHQKLWIITAIISILLLIAFAIFCCSSSKLPLPITPRSAIPKHALTPTSSEPHTSLQQPIPQDAASAQDELAKLNDIQQRLQHQQKLLQQQNKDADQLLELKQQQLEELQQQLKAS